MKKILLIAAVLFASVSCYDDSKLWESINDHESRISELERLCAEMNTNISALQSLVSALEQNDYITGVSPIEKNGAVIGYTISFAYANSITIYHGADGAPGTDGKDGADGEDGKDGADGQTPVIGVRQDTDGVYYWTLNGEWLLDASGNKIPTTGKDGADGEDGKDGVDGSDGAPGADGKDGTDGEDGKDGADGTPGTPGSDGKDGADGAPGQDGITPQLKIEDGYWYVSYDNGASWTEVGKATGDQGPQGNPGVGGDSMFTDIDYSSSDEYVIFILSNGARIQIPTWYAFESLKVQCEQMNSNIEALQTIVSALQNNDYVTDVIPVVENGKEVGYIIKFSNSGNVTIYHGQNGSNGADGAPGTDGADGQTPVIGVRQDTDGVYYWTLNGEWLLDASGNKIPTTGKDGADGEDGKDGVDGSDGAPGADGKDGTDGEDGKDGADGTPGTPGSDGKDGADGAPGQDGITPQLKIEDGYWYVSYDNGASWTEVGKATGDQGPQGNPGVGGDSMFTDIDYSSSDEYVIFILSNGARIQIPTWYAFESLKVQCEQMNSNIEALQTVVEVLQNNDYVTDIIPVVENGKDIGYIIKFSKSGSITIYHGKDGVDGADGTDGKDGIDGTTPVIGVRQDTDGVYYWTLNGEWLLDASGNKIPTTGKDGADGEDGKDGVDGSDGAPGADGADGSDGQDGAPGQDGKDGITPQLKIEDGYWYVSYDNGASWVEVGQATGDQGPQGNPGQDGDSFFQSITQDNEYVHFTLADGTVITLPKRISLAIEFDSDDLVVMATNSTRDIHYSVTSILPAIEVEVMSSADIKAKVVADNAYTGAIRVKTGDTIDEYSKVVVLVSNGEKVIMKTLTFEEEAIEVTDEAMVVASAEGGEVELVYLSNVECEVVIPEDAQGWITVAPTTRALQQRSVSLLLQPNTGYYRSATVTIKAIDGSLALEYVIEQDGDLGVNIDPTKIPDNEIWYVTNLGKDGFVCSFDPIAFDANIIEHAYEGGKWVIRFDNELKSIEWPSLVNISANTVITELYLPNTLEHLGNMAAPMEITEFYVPRNLKSICMPEVLFGDKLERFYGENVTDDGRCIVIDGKLLAFAPAGVDEYIIPEGITTIGQQAVCSNELKTITIPEGVKYLEDEAFMRCPNIEYISLPSSLIEMGGYAFFSLRNLKRVKGNSQFVSNDGYYLYRPDFRGKIMMTNFASGAGLESYEIPDGVEVIESYAFYYAESLKELTFPSTLAELASASCFEGTYNIEIINGPNVTDDNRSLVVNGVLQYVAPKGLRTYTTPSDVVKLSYGCLNFKPELESVIISDEVESVGDAISCRPYEIPLGYILQNNTTLKTVTISAKMRILGMDPFGSGANAGKNDSKNVEEIYLRAPIPPIIGHNLPEAIPTLFPYLTIYVPEESLEAYMSSPDWAPYRGYFKGYNYTDLPENDTYVSSDYSKDGVVTTLQTATKGSGIDVVLMGDAYSDRQIADGTYAADMEYIYNNLFTEEPYKSFKDYFNVHYVNVVSATEGYEYGNTALDTFFGDGTYVGGSDNACFEYALNAISENDMDEALIIVAMNSDAYAGTCYMYYPTYATGTYGSGPSVAYFPKGGDETTFAQLLHHEANGHGFAKLADEYAYESYGTVPSDYVSQIQTQQNEWGWWKNVDFTSDPTATRWSHFVNDTRYANEGLGAYEGGLTYWSGVWRPTENSIMRYNTGGFNAPSREAIYYRIHKLAYGDSWEYDYEDFVEYDAVNRATSASAPQKTHRNYVERPIEPTTPPVVVGKSWRTAM